MIENRVVLFKCGKQERRENEKLEIKFHDDVIPLPFIIYDKHSRKHPSLYIAAIKDTLTAEDWKLENRMENEILSDELRTQ